MAALRYSTMATSSLSHLTKPPAPDFSPRVSTSLEKSICNSSLSPETLLALSLLIIFSVDGTPIRQFKNSESIGVPYPKNQPMRIYSSLWNADDWATRGGLVKTDWTKAPFTASYRNFNANACVISSSGASSCTSSANNGNSNAWLEEQLDSTSQERLKWVQKNYMIYNYCSDSKRFPQGLPPECVTS
ncbi:hypothetical protein RHGRI_000150 [Rhododendron griersonianum]|uniref:xyloglucan:xyloglucosyl transferase n=1 Tax=Rhododendron griersonianum TaxID=479676 RepID=A0AAV6LGL2_9ERIC|nr:hypothetical protein RHGRI_000150 [Rhododendron griersonianum]